MGGRYVGAVAERPLTATEWAALTHASAELDTAWLVDNVGGALLTHVKRQLVRRAATDAVRLRVLELRSPGRRQTDDADAAADRLANTLTRMNEQQDEDVEPAATAIALLTRGEYAAACAAAQAFVKPYELAEHVVHALHLPRHDSAVSIALIMEGVAVPTALEVGSILGERGWWPEPLRRLVVGHVRAGNAIGPLTGCLDELGFANLSPMQQRAALALLSSPGNPYGLDGVAIAAAVRGVAVGDERPRVDMWRQPEP